MKKNSLSYGRMVATILIIAIISCAVSVFSPAFAHPKKIKTEKVAIITTAEDEAIQTKQKAADQLVQQLMKDGMVNEVQGFVVEKKKGQLYINWKLQPAELANKYLPVVAPYEEIHVRVFSLQERLKMHPDLNLIQVMMPVSFESPCIVKPSKKPGY